MKKGILVVLLALAVGAAAFFITRSLHHTGRSEVMLDSMPELEWLHRDLGLNDDQFAQVSKLHAAYRPHCAEMCRRISEAQEKLDALAQDSKRMTPELDQAIHDLAAVRADCRSHMLEHLYQTAALMNEQQSSRYLKTVLPAALDSPSCGASSCSHH